MLFDIIINQLNKMMKELLLLCLLSIVALGVVNNPKANPNSLKDDPSIEVLLDPITAVDLEEFNNWQKKFAKNYDKAEQHYRLLIFKKNSKEVKGHNSKSDKKFKMETNQFADQTKEEFMQLHLGATPPPRDQYLQKIKNKKKGEILSPVEIPTLAQLEDLIKKQKEDKLVILPPTSGSQPVNTTDAKVKTNNGVSTTRNLQIVTANPPPINWVTLGKMSPVKDQGVCGSCYAYSATSAIESALIISQNITVDLSEQQLIDCSVFMGNDGCYGGWPDYSFNYIIYFNLTNETNYPYRGNWSSCDKVGGEFKIKTYEWTNQDNICLGLLEAVQVRPLPVAVDALPWIFYSEGILNNCKPPEQTYVNHAALLAGFDKDKNWIIKNSWGVYWGQKGYLRLAAGNNCGICTYPGMQPIL